MRNPQQPVIDDHFKPNKIVQFLLREGPFDLNTLANMDFSQDDMEQFAQLIGYSVLGYHELPYVSDESALAAGEGCRTHGCDFHSGVPVV
jgi:hypothetical protein